MIPKIIHTFWLSNTEPADFLKENMKTWKACNPNYEIKIHRLTEFEDLLNKVPYLRHNIDTKQWAYATDYLRCVVLFKEGGWYFDADVICHKSLDELIDKVPLDRYLSYEAYSRFIECGVMAFEPNDELMKSMCDYYEHRDIESNVVMPIVMSKVIKTYDLNSGYVFNAELLSGKLNKELDKVFPTEHSYTVHHFSHTGYNKELNK